MLPNPRFAPLQRLPTSQLEPGDQAGSTSSTLAVRPRAAGNKTQAELDEERADSGGMSRGHNFVNEAPMGFAARRDISRVSKRQEAIAVTMHIALSDSTPMKLKDNIQKLRASSAILNQEAGGIRFDACLLYTSPSPRD